MHSDRKDTFGGLGAALLVSGLFFAADLGYPLSFRRQCTFFFLVLVRAALLCSLAGRIPREAVGHLVNDVYVIVRV